MMKLNGLTYIEDFVVDSQILFGELRNEIDWDERMKARLTASFGTAYNYSQITYPYREMPPRIGDLCCRIEARLNFAPNNCLINFYPDGRSRMGFHSDQTDILADKTGIAIISLGEIRTLRFRKIGDETEIIDYPLDSGSLIYMPQEIQTTWQHSIPKSKTENPRMSLTFRKIKN